MKISSNNSHIYTILTYLIPINKSRLRMHSSLQAYSEQDSPPSPGKGSRSNSRKSTGNVDDVRSNGWLDAMKASSPPRKKLIKGFSNQVASIDDDFEDYCSWMVKLLFNFISSFNICWLLNLFVIVVVVLLHYLILWKSVDKYG